MFTSALVLACVLQAAAGLPKAPELKPMVPEMEVQTAGERFPARAKVRSYAEKQSVCQLVHTSIPQMKVYERRTDRNIRVFRLRRLETEADNG